MNWRVSPRNEDDKARSFHLRWLGGPASEAHHKLSTRVIV